MKPLEISKIAQAIGAPYEGAERLVTEISTDTRSLPPGCLFVALKGDNFDGNEYVAAALASGASFAVAQRLPADVADERVLLVADGRQALLEIAGLYRRELGVTVIGVTGSVGKTTTKEMVACVAEAGFPTWKTQANLNNEVGLSQTILQLEERHQVLVLEMGVDGPAQMAPMARCARPDLCVLTNIGVSHLQQFGTKEAILREKTAMAVASPDAVLILNADDDLLCGYDGGGRRILRYGIDHEDADAKALALTEDSTGVSFQIRYANKRFDAWIPVPGQHNVRNALAAFLAGTALGMEPEQAAAALRNYTPEGMRQKVVSHGGYTVVEDCYNASPDSMQAALSTLGTYSCKGKRIAVLSDMLELGDIEREAHYETGRIAAQSGVDLLLCTGERAREYERGAKAAGMEHALHFETQQQLSEHLRKILSPGDVAWFKASRGMKLEQVIQSVYKGS